jgi:hypothetical protein
MRREEQTDTRKSCFRAANFPGKSLRRVIAGTGSVEKMEEDGLSVRTGLNRLSSRGLGMAQNTYTRMDSDHEARKPRNE